MNMFEKLKEFINGTDDDYIESNDVGYEDESAYEAAEEPVIERREQPRARTHERAHDRPVRSSASNVVPISSGAAAAPAAKQHIVVRSIERYERDAGEVVQVLKQGRIVILNLENCPEYDAQRTIDFFYGITCYTGGRFEKIAGGVYVITPAGVKVTSDLVEGFAAADEEQV
ncbi:MAG: cell division protein SepF [Clostridia bacterium]|nr:cell division protein SepF [Clostridia bacterium]